MRLGAIAESAAAVDGANVVGVTLSTEQLAYAQDRLARAGLGGRADLRLQDYRDVDDGPFDAVVSIEMFEAVGREYWDAYFQTVHKQLKPGAKACVQAIVIRADLFERYARSTDFIQRYVFPGGMLPSIPLFVQHAQAAGLKVVEQFSFGPDYAETLRRWRAAFMARLDDVRRQGFDERFLRLWEFYLGYCEAAFDAGNTDVVQFTLHAACESGLRCRRRIRYRLRPRQGGKNSRQAPNSCHTRPGPQGFEGISRSDLRLTRRGPLTAPKRRSPWEERGAGRTGSRPGG